MKTEEMIAYNKKRIQEDSRWYLITWARKYGENNYYAEKDDDDYDDDDADCMLD